jgi:hypothetical protein
MIWNGWYFFCHFKVSHGGIGSLAIPLQYVTVWNYRHRWVYPTPRSCSDCISHQQVKLKSDGYPTLRVWWFIEDHFTV